MMREQYDKAKAYYNAIIDCVAATERAKEMNNEASRLRTITDNLKSELFHMVGQACTGTNSESRKAFIIGDDILLVSSVDNTVTIIKGQRGE